MSDYGNLYRVRWTKNGIGHSKFIFGRDDALDEWDKIKRLFPDVVVKVTKAPKEPR